MTAVLDRMRGLSAAEEFFALLDVPYDPKVLAVARLHILRRMGSYLSDAALDGADDTTAHALCQAQLQRAYDDFVASSPLEQRVFKVLQDAAAPRPRGFVPLDQLTVPAKET